MGTAPATTTSAAPAAPTGSAAPTPAAAASTQPPVTVSTGAPGTSSANEPPAGATSGKWFDSFDADLKEYVTQKGFQDPKSVTDAYRNLEKLRGVPAERLLKLPEQNSADYDKSMGEVFEKLGKPATPEGYGLAPKDAKNEKQTQFTDWAKNTFHKLNLTATQGQELIKQFNAFSEAQTKASGEAFSNKVKEQGAALQKEWGAAYNQNIARAQAAYRQLGIPDAAIDSLEQSIGFDGVMKMFNKLGSQVGEHGFVGGDGNQSFGEGAILTPEQANAKIKALKADSNFTEKYLKGDVKAKQELERLHKMAHPEPST